MKKVVSFFFILLFSISSVMAVNWREVFPKNNPTALYGLVVYGKMSNGKATSQFHPSAENGNEMEAWMFSVHGSDITIAQINTKNGNRRLDGTISGDTATMTNGEVFTILEEDSGLLMLLDGKSWYRLFQKIEE